MKLLKRQVAFALLASAMFFPATTGAYPAGDVFQDHEVVHDARGNVVTSTFGYCVHTRQTPGTGECATVAAPKPAPVVREPEPRVYK